MNAGIIQTARQFESIVVASPLHQPSQEPNLIVYGVTDRRRLVQLATFDSTGEKGRLKNAFRSHSEVFEGWFRDDVIGRRLVFGKSEDHKTYAVYRNHREMLFARASEYRVTGTGVSSDSVMSILDVSYFGCLQKIQLNTRRGRLPVVWDLFTFNIGEWDKVYPLSVLATGLSIATGLPVEEHRKFR